MGGGNNRIYDTISILFLLLTFGFIIYVVVSMTKPVPQDPNALVAANLPTAFAFPTFTPTSIVPTLPPSFTPTSTNTETPTPTLTETPVPLPSSTITNTPAPTLTPSLTFTPSISPTFTAQPSPTGPTATLPPVVSPYPFEAVGGIQFMANFAAPSAGCLWQGIGGRVRGLDGNEVAAGSINVVVYDSTNTFSQTVPVGSNTQYGSISGWEVRVADTINANTYYVTLYTAQNNTQVSDHIQIAFPSNCDQNLAFLDLQRVR